MNRNRRVSSMECNCSDHVCRSVQFGSWHAGNATATSASLVCAPPYVAIHSMVQGREGLRPLDIRRFYGFDHVANLGAGQIIGIVDAYDDPTLSGDLAVFDRRLDLASCTTSNGCLNILFSSGTHPSTNISRAMEISPDVERAHAIAPQARILLVETPTDWISDLMDGVDSAVQEGASSIAMMRWSLLSIPFAPRCKERI